MDSNGKLYSHDYDLSLCKLCLFNGSCYHIAYESCDGFVNSFEESNECSGLEEQADTSSSWEEMSYHKIPNYNQSNLSQRIRQESSLQREEGSDD